MKGEIELLKRRFDDVGKRDDDYHVRDLRVDPKAPRHVLSFRRRPWSRRVSFHSLIYGFQPCLYPTI